MDGSDMATEKMDRRVRKTRALLLQGLIKLMNEKDISDISVKELSDLADINRGTFYLHYNDIFDMVDKIEKDLFVEFNSILDRNLTAERQVLSPGPILLDIFTFLERHRDLAKVMIGPHGDLAFVNHLKALVEERLHHLMQQERPSPDYGYNFAFVVSGYIGVIELWLNRSDPHSPEEMAEICSGLFHSGFFVEKK